MTIVVGVGEICKGLWVFLTEEVKHASVVAEGDAVGSGKGGEGWEVGRGGEGSEDIAAEGKRLELRGRGRWKSEETSVS
jgi:hypothetical protein